MPNKPITHIRLMFKHPDLRNSILCVDLKRPAFALERRLVQYLSELTDLDPSEFITILDPKNPEVKPLVGTRATLLRQARERTIINQLTG